MLQLMKVACSLAVLAAPALARGGPRPETLSTTDQAQKDQVLQTRENANRASRDRQPRPLESDRPTVGPQTTQGLMQDAIARSNSR